MKKTFLLLLVLSANMYFVHANDALNPNYVYSEPTIVVNSEEQGSNLVNYSFICNNVQVDVTKGARYANETNTYFGVNAGENITFTTTQQMKAIIVNGYIKKDFDATVSTGTILYADASEDLVEAEQVLAVTDINATTLTINCVKQLRCYSVSIYFVAIPEININPGGEVEFSYYWEPEEPTTMDITFTEMEYQDMTDNLAYACTSLAFYNDTFEMQLAVFAATTGGETILPVGTYPINDTYAENTIQASPGGDEYLDYPSCLFTDFETDESGNELYNPYYLVSGQLVIEQINGRTTFTIDASSYNGSTIHACYIHGASATENISAYSKAIKILRNGQILLRHGEAIYTIFGSGF